MMNVLVDNGESAKAIAVYDMMLRAEVSPSIVRHKLAMKSCAFSGDLERGIKIHDTVRWNKSIKLSRKLQYLMMMMEPQNILEFPDLSLYSSYISRYG